MSKRVWLVGAGFSRSLGGPLMHDLLAPHAREMLIDLYPSVESLKKPKTALVFGAYSEGARVKGNGLWEDPEAFLEYLEASLDDNHRLKRLKGVLSHAPGKVLEIDWEDQDRVEDVIRACILQAKRLVAAHADAFLHGVTTEKILNEERWGPYVKWYQQLTPEDTIISFNYDRVIELLSEALRGETIGASLVTSPEALAKARGRTALCFKLHGSTDWKLTKEGQDGWRFAVIRPGIFFSCSSEEIAIATPGRSKVATAKNFSEAWSMAEKALIEAAQVFLMGYRFPPSDAEARRRILGAIQGSQCGSITAIVGDDQAERERLGDMLRIARDVSIDVPRLRAEEFLSIWAPTYSAPKKVRKVSWP